MHCREEFINFKNMFLNDYQFNSHCKEDFPPAHTCEHLLNQLMVRMFGTTRSHNSHIERKKSMMSFVLETKPGRKEEKVIEQEMNRLIDLDMPVICEMVNTSSMAEKFPIENNSLNASEKIRVVKIGDYDVCPCIGKHVRSTRQIGRFELLGTNWDEYSKTYKLRFKVIPS